MTAVDVAASRDPATGEVYVPPRRFAADGSLRPCEVAAVPAAGILCAVTSFAGQWYGLVDLDHDIRVQVRLAADDDDDDDEPAVGERYAGRRTMQPADAPSDTDIADISELEFHRA